MSHPAPSNDPHTGASDRPTEPPSQSQPSGQQPSAEFNPFPFGAPTPDSPVAAAFPEIFPTAAPEPNPFAPPAAPPWAVPASPYPESAPSPWAPPAGTRAQQPVPDSARHPDEQYVAPAQTFHGHYPGQPAAGSAPGQYASGQYPSDHYAPAQQWPGYPTAGYPTPHHAINGKAIAGMVLGIVSIAFFFLTVLDVPLIVLGIVFSTLGLRAARRGEGRRAMALAGLICSIVAAAVVVVALTYVAHRSSVCENRFDRGSANYNNCMIHFN